MTIEGFGNQANLLDAHRSPLYANNMKINHVDIHAHINFSDFDADRDQLIQNAKDKELAIINIGTGIETSKQVIELSKEHENLFAIAGLHPIYIKKDSDTEKMISELESLITENPATKDGSIRNLVGVGECGLDYFHIKETEESEIKIIKEKQAEIFRAQIDLAIKHDFPIMIHCRSASSNRGGDAYLDVLEILSDYAGKVRGNIHFFAGDKEIAQKFLDLGFTISFTGVITFAEQYRELVEFVPLDKIHAETDCPYVSPAPHRGKRNEPANSIIVAEKIAEIKGLDFEEVKQQLVANAKSLFQLPI